MIHFSCPTCQADLEVSDALATQVSTCPDCGKKLRVPLVSQKTIQKKRTGTRGHTHQSSFTVFFMAFGLVVSFFGCFLTLFYWLVYNTTVSDTPELPFRTSIEHVHNVGLMNNRTVGIIVGVGLALGGLLLILGGYLGSLLEQQSSKPGGSS